MGPGGGCFIGATDGDKDSRCQPAAVAISLHILTGYAGRNLGEETSHQANLEEEEAVGGEGVLLEKKFC